MKARRALILVAAVLLAASDVRAGAVEDKVRSLSAVVAPGLKDLDTAPEKVRTDIYYGYTHLLIRLKDIQKPEDSPVKDPNLLDKLRSEMAVAFAPSQRDVYLKMIDDIKSPLYRADAHTGVGEAEAPVHEVFSQEHYGKALELIRTLDYAEDRVPRVKALIRSEVQTKHARLALDALDEIETDEERCPLLWEIVETADDAELVTIEHRVARLKLEYCQNRTMAEIAVRRAGLGDDEKAAAAIEKLPEGALKARTLVRIAVTRYKADPSNRNVSVLGLQQAAKIAAELPEGPDKAALYTEIAVAFMMLKGSEEGHVSFQKARLAARKIEKKEDAKASSLVQIGSREHESGFKGEAVENFQEAKRAIAGIENDPKTSAMLLFELAEAMGTAGGEPDPVRELYRRALNLADSLEKPSERVVLAIRIAASLNRAGQPDESKDVFLKARGKLDDITLLEERVRFTAELALEMARAGFFEDSAVVIETIEEELARTRTFAGMLALMVAAEHSDDAIAAAYAHSKPAMKLAGLLGIAGALLDKQEKDRQKK